MLSHLGLANETAFAMATTSGGNRNYMTLKRKVKLSSMRKGIKQVRGS